MVRARFSRALIAIIAASGTALFWSPNVNAQASSPAHTVAAATSSNSGSSGSHAPPLHARSRPTGPAAPMNVAGTDADSVAAAKAAAAQRAEATGKPTVVEALTTATTVTTANPHGGFTIQENVLPVRVRRGTGWIPVNTSLVRSGQRWVASAVPGDQVSFSGGAGVALATISAGGTSLSLDWPSSLPTPVVSGSSATYRDVLPGVDLVMTASAAQAGGFSEVLVIKSPTAARNPALAHLALSVSEHGTGRLSKVRGGLVSVAAHAHGYYAAAAPLMWDSSFAASPGSAAAERVSARGSGEFVAGMAQSAGRTSTVVGPGLGARVASVGTKVATSGGSLGLMPDAAMLASPSTRYPVFVDPSFSWNTQDGNRQHYDDVQAGCPTASHYDSSDSAYWSLGVGYDGWSGCNGNFGQANGYYVLTVPSQVWGGYINDATVNAQEAYTASCSVTANVTLSWSNLINSGTDWSNQPSVVSNVSTVNVGPSPQSCNTVVDEDSSAWLGVGFGVKGTIAKAASGHWKTFTIRLWEPGDTNRDDWKRFGKNPYLQITYNQAPNTPSGLQISTGGAGSQCVSSPYPWVGKLSSGGTTMSAVVSDKDGDELQGNFQYKLDTATTWTPLTSTSTALKSGKRAQAVIPASFTNSLAAGTLVDWRVQGDDGAPTGDANVSGWSATCKFHADPATPPPPTVTAQFTTDPAAGTSVSFTIASNDPGTDPAKQLVWGLDQTPSSDGPPAAQVINLASGQTSATVTVHVPGPGPHALYAYAKDAAGNVSQWSGSSDPAQFSATADPAVSYPSFAAALSANQSFDNEMISSSTTSSGTGNADGAGNSFPLSEVENAGWNPGGTVTIDGARFTLPNFGSGGPDNVLAANQTIGMPSGSQGSSLVFLVSAANADANALDASDLPSDDVTAPYIPQGTRVAGMECDSYQAGLDDPSCTLPSGTITYDSASGAVPQSYDLTVPDWVSGPDGPTVLRTPDRATSGGTAAVYPNIYAFSVPLNPGAEVASVTLPDVSAELSATGGVTDGPDTFPALHVLGIAVANTTTATPGGSSLAAGQAWTGAWQSPSEGVLSPPSSQGTLYQNETFRIATRVSAGGSSVRLRLSDDLGWLGDAAGFWLKVQHVTVAPQASGASVTGPPVTATFGGSQTVAVVQGTDAYSDPVPMTVTPGEKLTVSIFLQNPLKYVIEHTYCSACTEYVTAAGAGDQTANTDGSPFSGSGTASGQYSNILTGIDVQTAGTPTVSVLGDGLIDAGGPGTTTPLLAPRVSDDLASSLQSAAGTGNQPTFGVVGAGIESNTMLEDRVFLAEDTAGTSTLSRLVHDVLAEPGVGTVIVYGGMEDDLVIGSDPVTEAQLEDDAYGELATQLNAWGISVIFTTMTPCAGYAGGVNPRLNPDVCSTGSGGTVDAFRTDLNSSYIMAQFDGQPAPCLLAPCNYADDFGAAVSNGASPEALIAADDAGDHINLSAAGYAAAAATIPENQLTAVTPPTY